MTDMRTLKSGEIITLAVPYDVAHWVPQLAPYIPKRLDTTYKLIFCGLVEEPWRYKAPKTYNAHVMLTGAYRHEGAKGFVVQNPILAIPVEFFDPTFYGTQSELCASHKKPS